MDNTHDIIDLEQKYLLGTYARALFVLDHGQGCWVYDTDGNAYLDRVAGIAVDALGHADPGLVAVLTAQAWKLWHVSNLYHTAPHARLAQKLCGTSFADRVLNSGAEANEGAFKFARKWAHDHFGAEKHAIVAFSDAFTGGRSAHWPPPREEVPGRLPAAAAGRAHRAVQRSGGRGRDDR